jgi:hypothetical protein
MEESSMKKILIINLSACLALVFLLVSCGEKTPVLPPVELLNDIASLEARCAEIKNESDVSPAQVKAFDNAMAATKAAMDEQNFKKASQTVRVVKMELTKLDALMEYKKLEVFNPSNNLTFHYRKSMQEGDDLNSSGEIEAAIEKYDKAKEQVTLSLGLQSQCMESSRANIQKTKDKLELIYKPDEDILNLFWDTVDVLERNDCNRISQNLLKIQKYIEIRERSTISEKGIFIVQATQDHIKKYGDPIMYSRVRPDGYLETRINRVPVGFSVYFKKCKLFNRETTFYFVKDPRTNIEGWMAERYVWPERAAKTTFGR